MTFTQLSNPIFVQAIRDYHVSDNVDTPIANPYEEGTIENRLYLKCWIDTVQWHFEDIIRDPDIDPKEALDAMVQTSNVRYYCGLGEYIDLGYVPLDKYATAASNTLEYCYDDWTIYHAALLAGETLRLEMTAE